VFPNSPQSAEYSVRFSGIGCWFAIAVLVFLLASAGFGWLAQGVLIFLAVLLLAPVAVLLSVQLWLRRKLVSDRCPTCATEFVAWRGANAQCPNCGEALQVSSAGKFERLTPPGTVDVEAVEISSTPIFDDPARAPESDS